MAFRSLRLESSTLTWLESHFGSTSDLYKKLVLDEQVVDGLFWGNAASQDPSLCVVYAQLRDWFEQRIH